MGTLVQVRDLIVNAKANDSLAITLSFNPDTACYVLHPLPPLLSRRVNGFPANTPARVLAAVARLAEKKRFVGRVSNFTPISVSRAAALQPATSTRRQLLREIGKVLEADGHILAANTARLLASEVDKLRITQSPQIGGRARDGRHENGGDDDEDDDGDKGKSRNNL